MCIRDRKYILDKGKESDINVLQVSTVTKGLKGKELVDFDEMFEAGAVGFSDDGIPIKHTKLVYEAMKKAKELNVPISLHEENPVFIKKAGVNDGKVSKELGLEGGATSLAENIMVSRDVMIAVSYTHLDVYKRQGLDPFVFPHITQFSFFIGHLFLLWGAVYCIFIECRCV